MYEKLRPPGHPDIARNLNNLAVLLVDQARYAEAEPLHKRALAMRERVLPPGSPEIAANLHNLAFLYKVQGRHEEAEHFAARTLALRERTLRPEHPDVALSLWMLGSVYLNQGRLLDAAPLLQRAASINDKSPIVLYDLARLTLASGNWPDALAYSRRASENLIARDEQEGNLSGDTPELFRLHVQTAYHAGPNDPRLREEAYEMAQRAQRTEAGRALTQMAARQATGSDQLSYLVRERQDLQSQLRAADERLSDALSRADTHRANGVRDQITALASRLKNIDAQLAQTFPEYTALANPRPLSIDTTQGLLMPDEVLLQVLETRETPHESFAWLVTKNNVRWVKLAVAPENIATNVDALRCGLDPSAWDNEKDTARCRELIGVAGEKNALLPFDVVKAYELYQAILGPFKEEIKGKRLLIVVSGPLATLPINVLVTEKPSERLPKTADGYRTVKWLGTQNAITVLPSLTSLHALRNLAKGRRAPELFIGFGDPALRGNPNCGTSSIPAACPDAPSVAQRVASLLGAAAVRSPHRALTRAPVQSFFNGNLANVDVLQAQCPLPETSFELKCVAKSLGVPESQIRVRDNATETAIKRAELDRYQIVHFATHGLLARQTKQATGSLAEPALLLSPPQVPTETDDGLLTASEIAQLKLNADWVVLSACNTAAAADGTGEETLSGLARAFFYAGARALMVSYWAVDSDAAVLLTTRAFAELRQDSSIGRAEALRRSIQAVIEDKSRPYGAHPSFWAPFVVVGEGRIH
jgi:CHAT domain-containing protein/tetratricopeptide (TPR) repeat protein